MIFAFVIACSTEAPQSSDALEPFADAAVTLYASDAEALRTAIEGDDAGSVAAKANALTERGRAMLPVLEAEHPECAPYFAALEKVAGTLHTFSLARIEKGFHADGELPKAPGPACYHGKDLVVHPATVSALTNTWDDAAKKKAIHEIDEVLEHLKQATH